ncbi:MAG: chorismate mutase [Calditrichaeota bacterium]|nr:MAG: chorismate mutase [Calditrichota bacterium]MBL1204202.1 chorismate mutase [Calditrichota bacterium]NOG44032.1 chorismate mutase [Calditrichota bacterium]
MELQNKIKKYRIEIDNIDAQLVSLLNNRALSATKIGHIKREYNAPVYVPSREEDVIRNVQEVNQGPLSNNALKRLFERIIDESRRLERETTHKE